MQTNPKISSTPYIQKSYIQKSLGECKSLWRIILYHQVTIVNYLEVGIMCLHNKNIEVCYRNSIWGAEKVSLKIGFQKWDHLFLDQLLHLKINFLYKTRIIPELLLSINGTWQDEALRLQLIYFSEQKHCRKLPDLRFSNIHKFPLSLSVF